MGEHKGWRVRPDRDRHRAEVWDPLRKAYRSKTFTEAADARKWAKTEAAGVITGTPSAAVTAGRALVSQLRKDYLDNLRARGRSASHLANVTLTMDGLQGAAPDLADQGAGRAIERWLDRLTVAPSSRNRMLVEVRAFCRWCQKWDLLDKDPTRALERASVPSYLRPQFTLSELQILLGTMDPYRIRFALMLYSGLRVDEAATLTYRDIDLSGGLILVRLGRGRLKRQRERIVPLQNDLQMLICPVGRPTDLVAPIGDSNDRRAFAGFLTRHGVAVEGRSPHSCRHTYAGLMTATGVPGPLLSAYLGHSSAATTMLYTKLAARYAQVVQGWPMGKLALSSVPAP